MIWVLLIALVGLGVCEIIFQYGWDTVKTFIVNKLNEYDS